MMIVNRFIEIAESYGDHEIPISRIFRGADLSESDSVVEAMYVIADRRASSGKPIEITEITSGIPDLVECKSVLDAAIDICLDGLVSQGFSKGDAYDTILQSTASVLDKECIEESAEVAAFIEHSTRQNTIQVRRLPIDFGNNDLDGCKRYDLRRFLGSGSQGVMYEAVDRVFAEEGHPSLVAIKIAHENQDGDRSLLEGARARRVRHKNVARVHDCGRVDSGESYVTYEYIDGLQLDVWIKNLQSSLSPREACSLVANLAEGVQSAHNAGVIHRDLKPSNILMTRENDPIVTDFGIAHSLSNDAGLCSYYGTRGSLAFMAPEQYQGCTDGVMPSVDTYALGGLLYWLLTGRFPNGDTVSAAITRLGNNNEVGAENINCRDLEPRLARVVERALASDLSVRYNSAASFALDLDSYLSMRPIPWLDQSWVVRSKFFAKRNPFIVGLNFVVMGLIGIMVAIWMSSQAQIQLEQAQSNAALVIQRAESDARLEQVALNSQIELEQDRVEQLRARNLMAKNMLQAWSQAADNHGDESLAVSNMLFLYTVSTNGFLDDDHKMTESLLTRRIDIAEEHLATLSSSDSSPIHRAQWHEMLGMWYVSHGNPKGFEHLLTASDLVSVHAPNDLVWNEKLKTLLIQHTLP